MNTKRLIWCLPALLVFGACSDDKDKDKNPDGPQGGGTMETLSPEASKQYLQQTASEFLDLFKPADQKDVIELASYFDATYGGFDMPEEFDIDADTKGYMYALRQAASGDLDALTRAAYAYSYTINFQRFAGVYEPNSSRKEWVKTGNSDKIIFKFTNAAGTETNITVAQSGGTSQVDFTYMERWYDYIWDPNKQDYDKEEVRETYSYYLSIPKTVEVTLVSGGKQLAASKVTSSIDTKKHTLSADVQATLCNLGATAKVTGDNTRVEANTEFIVSGKKVANAYATMTGKDLCDITKWEEMVNNDKNHIDYPDNDDIIAGMIDKLDCGADVLGKVQVYGQGTYYKQFPDDTDFYESCWGEYTKDQAKKLCEDACSRLNKNIKTQLRYDGTKTDQATMTFAPYLDVWGEDYWDYTVEAKILFPDGTSYSIDSYFEKFTTVSNKWDVLIDAYEKVWDAAKPKRAK